MVRRTRDCAALLTMRARDPRHPLLRTEGGNTARRANLRGGEAVEAAAELAIGGDGAVLFRKLHDLVSRHLAQRGEQLFLRTRALVGELARRFQPHAVLVEQTEEE